MANSNYSATCGYLNTALHMEIVSALVFISDYVASNAPRMILKEAILNTNRYRIIEKCS